MRYSYEFKKMCIEMYRNGTYPETPEGLSEFRFRKTIRQWVRMEEAQGIEVLQHKNKNRVWTAEEKLELVAHVLAGKSCTEVSVANGINSGQLYNWVRKYKELGYNGLANMKKGRPSKEPQMEKRVTLEPLTESEREELIRLRAETEYLRTELAVRKKLEALRQEKEAAQLKAKKQRSSRNSVTKDID